MKRCTKCNELKPLTEFGKQKGRKNYIKSVCRKCGNEYAHQRYIRDREKCLREAQKYRERNKEMLHEKYREWYVKNKERCTEKAKQRYTKNRDKVIKMVRSWEIEHPEKTREMRKKSFAKIRSTEKGRLNRNITTAVYRSLRGTKAGRHWENLVGFTVDQLKSHLEKLFTSEMNWGNYGTVWEIDHKIPIAVFNFEKPEHIDFRLCWSLKNLQPLESKKNASKCAKLENHFQPSLKLNIGAR